MLLGTVMTQIQISESTFVPCSCGLLFLIMIVYQQNAKVGQFPSKPLDPGAPLGTI